MAELPNGTVTFLLTDVEGSTALWEDAPEAMRHALARHDRLFETVVAECGGVHIRPRGEGDSRFAVFSSVSDAAAAAITLQRGFAGEPWPTPRPVKVRIGIHTGEAELRDGDYYGAEVNRCARIRSIGHGGQILVSGTAGILLRDTLPGGAALHDLGTHNLRGLTQPERVFQIAAADLPSAFPALGSPHAPPHQVPIQRSPLIGRETETADVRALVVRPDTSLVTLIGPGGTGKTRLAIQVAAELLDQFSDGIYFVPIASIRDPDLVASTIGHALSIPMDSGRPPLDALKDWLQERELLLILDNLEQVLDAADQFAELLATADRLKILVTSRVALRLSAEHTYEVPPLPLPQHGVAAQTEEDASALGQYGAIRLFVERAQAVRTDFALTSANAGDVAEICRRLDGLPLAIELAAARARLLPPAAMLARLAGPIGSPALRLLTGGPRDQPARLQTLRNTIAWSYDLLELEEQALLRRLAIFVDGCTIEAIEAVCGDDGRVGASGRGHAPPMLSLAQDSILDLVDSLLAQSLVRRMDGTDDEPRYTMLETIREYGLESLGLTGELPALRRWHAEYFLTLAETAEPRMRGGEQHLWLDRLEVEQDNLRAALDWSLSDDGDAELALRLSGAAAWFWYHRAHLGEARSWLRRALNRTDGSPTARMRALAGAGRLAHIQHDSAEARALLGESLTLAREIGDRWWSAWVLHLLGRVAYFEGDAETARRFGNECLTAAQEIHDEWLEGWGLHLLGLASHIVAEHAPAREFYEKSLAIRRRLDFREGVGTVLTLTGLIEFSEGNYQSARELYREGLHFYQGIDWGWLMGNLVAEFVALAVCLGQPERAARLSGALTALSESVRIRPIPLIEVILGPAIEETRQLLGDAVFAAEQQIGRRMSPDAIIAEALAIDEGPRLVDVPLSPQQAPSRGQPDHLPDGLTAREAEVLRLIAAGCTSQEIAERLVISIHTVERHITHVYQKIGTRGRADATAYAMQHGLARPE